MITNWRYLNILFLDAKPISPSKLQTVWVNKKSRSIIRRFLFTPALLKCITTAYYKLGTAVKLEILKNSMSRPTITHRLKGCVVRRGTTYAAFVLVGAIVWYVFYSNLAHNFSIWAIITLALTMPALLL